MTIEYHIQAINQVLIFQGNSCFMPIGVLEYDQLVTYESGETDAQTDFF